MYKMRKAVQREIVEWELDDYTCRTNIRKWIISDHVSILQCPMRINERKAGRFRTILREIELCFSRALLRVALPKAKSVHHVLNHARGHASRIN